MSDSRLMAKGNRLDASMPALAIEVIVVGDKYKCSRCQEAFRTVTEQCAVLKEMPIHLGHADEHEDSHAGQGNQHDEYLYLADLFHPHDVQGHDNDQGGQGQGFQGQFRKNTQIGSESHESK